MCVFTYATNVYLPYLCTEVFIPIRIFLNNVTDGWIEIFGEVDLGLNI